MQGKRDQKRKRSEEEEEGEEAAKPQQKKEVSWQDKRKEKAVKRKAERLEKQAKKRKEKEEKQKEKKELEDAGFVWLPSPDNPEDNRPRKKQKPFDKMRKRRRRKNMLAARICRAKRKKKSEVSKARLQALEAQRAQLVCDKIYAELARAQTTKFCEEIYRDAVSVESWTPKPSSPAQNMRFLKETRRKMALIADLALQIQKINSNDALPRATRVTEEERALVRTDQV